MPLKICRYLAVINKDKGGQEGEIRAYVRVQKRKTLHLCNKSQQPR